MENARYASHLALPQIGEKGQQALRRSHVVVIGLGGIGAPAALYLAGAGVGRLTLADFDRVAESNLPRQVLYRPGDEGRRKVAVAAERLAECNPDTRVTQIDRRVNADLLRESASDADVWIDASDNYATRLACNEAALASSRPWIMAAAIRFEGQLACFRPDQAEPQDRPCYRCIYGQAAETLEDCAGAGVFSVAAGTMGLAAAGQAMALVCGLPVPLGLHLYDALSLSWHTLTTARQQGCPACSG